MRTSFIRLANMSQARSATSTAAGQPLILTLSLDPSTHEYLTGLRKKYFPPHRNHLSAHVTFFHALPIQSIDLVTEDLDNLCSRTEKYPIWSGPPFLMSNKGVGISVREAIKRTAEEKRALIQQAKEEGKKKYKREEDRTEQLHRRLLARWKTRKFELTNQDKMTLTRPHVTIQNKVEEEEAKACFAELSENWKDLKGTAVGFGLWEYQSSGAWTHLKEFNFIEPTKGNETT